MFKGTPMASLKRGIGNGLKSCKGGEAPRVQVYSPHPGNCSKEIVIQDNGIGFDEKYLDRIFAPVLHLKLDLMNPQLVEETFEVFRGNIIGRIQVFQFRFGLPAQNDAVVPAAFSINDSWVKGF